MCARLAFPQWHWGICGGDDNKQGCPPNVLLRLPNTTLQGEARRGSARSENKLLAGEFRKIMCKLHGQLCPKEWY